MSAIARFFHLPLLTKELTERAARRSTYVVRVLYALLFFGGVPLLMPMRFTIDQLGAGTELLRAVIGMQFIGIHVFVPALMCGLIAGEHERGSLPLLLLTPLSPGRIILQKYLAGLVPMFTMLLLGTPLLAVAYAYGGLGAENLVVSAWWLLLATLEVGAFALLCSVLCRDPVRAFLTTYFAGAAVIYLGGLLAGGARSLWGDRSMSFGQVENAVFFIPAGSQVDFTANGAVRLENVALWSAPAVVLTLGCLAIARWRLEPCAFRPPRPRWRGWTWTPDRALRAFNARFGGVIFARNDGELPRDEPIAWRECRRFGLGGRSQVLRVAAVGAIGLLLGILAICVRTLLVEDPPPLTVSVSLLKLGMVVLGALAMIGYATSAAGAERTRQTLEVLLTTPLRARDILSQKARLLWRIQAAFGAPLILLAVVQAAFFLTSGGSRAIDDSIFIALVGEVAAFLIYPRVLGWAALWLGVYCRTPRNALLAALGGITALLFASQFHPFAYGRTYDGGAPVWPLVLWHVLDPAEFQTTRANLHGYLRFGDVWVFVAAAHYAFHAGIARLFRWLCLTRVDRHWR